ncbi:SRPBCC family protein [Blastococcus sp. CT_GayMR16]|uniref:SRPBCC family protein n=1 Tax=Blastococcus sp. CT_GayMR16 TaxID=2559607 RepID=UPI0010733FB1|nr:SRPBCC family protein [Blastococcus sp. CT_GayMR16]TFV89950.1 dimethyladenosine transferase [Blastococcus sp. CT_GayMR16]
MSDQVSGSITIDAPAAVVFAILAAPRQHSRIDGSGSVGSIISGPERITAKGERFTVRMKLFGVPYVIVNRVVEFEQDRLIAWRHFTANRWRYELTPTPDGGTTVTETFDTSRADPVTDAVVRWAKFPERNREGIVGTLERLKKAAEADATA